MSIKNAGKKKEAHTLDFTMKLKHYNKLRGTLSRDSLKLLCINAIIKSNNNKREREKKDPRLYHIVRELQTLILLHMKSTAVPG